MKHVDSFGFLNYPTDIVFNGGSIVPRPNLVEAIEDIKSISNVDGFIYPPIINTYRMKASDSEEGELVPRTRRPAAVFDLQSSHDLTVLDPLNSQDIRNGDAGLLVHLCAFLFGTRLQFEGWRFDGPVPTKPTHNWIVRHENSQHFIDSVYATWRNWSPDLRKRFINILYMHCRTPSFLWEWDRFIHRYIVTDAIYKFFEIMSGKKTTGHARRINDLVSEFGITNNQAEIERIVTLRNELFHEALWEGETPGQRTGDTLLVEKWLGNLNERFILSICEYRNELSRSGWWFFGSQYFDKLK